MSKEKNFKKLAGILRKYANLKIKDKEMDIAWNKFAKEQKRKLYKK